MSDILKRAQELEGEVCQFLRDIIAIPSLSSQEGPVVERIKQEMEKIGYDEVKIDGFGNLMGRIGNGGRILAFDSHCDVVDVGNPDNWEFDPWKGDMKDGIIYGRGACDMKGPLASMVYAGKILKERGVPDDVTVWIVCSVQEEDCDGLCWHYIIKENVLKPDAVVICEPTSMNIYRGQRGRLELKVKTEGVSCHGSAPERGVNAVYKMAPIIQEVQELHTRLKSDPFLGKGSVTISDVRSTSPSLCAVADSCTIHLDRRLTVGDTIESAMEEIKALPSFAKGEAKIWVNQYDVPSYKGTKYPMESYFPTWVLPEDHEYLKGAVTSYKELFNEDPKVDKWTFSTNAVTIFGLHGIPSFGWGPGHEKHAHTAEEQVEIDHLVRATALYADFVYKF